MIVSPDGDRGVISPDGSIHGDTHVTCPIVECPGVLLLGGHSVVVVVVAVEANRLTLGTYSGVTK